MAFAYDISTMFPEPPAGLDLGALDPERVPAHVAVIMDGNGRWAKARGKMRLAGHKAGIEAVRETIRTASDVGVRYLTIYSFSSENWKRSTEEVSGLMDLFAKTMLAEVDALHEERVRVKAIGRLEALPPKTRAAFEQAWEKTKGNDGMTLLVAVNYGGRAEILDAANRALASRLAAASDAPADAGAGADGAGAASGALAAEGSFAPLTEEDIAAHLYAPEAPDPDLVIRTSGELRISNFLLWQVAYSEFYVTDVLWPDFDRYEFARALLAFQSRSRRFGGA